MNTESRDLHYSAFGLVHLYTMCLDPGKKLFITHLPRGYPKTCFNHIIVGTVQANAVDLKKGQHDIHSDSLVAIHKCMVGNQRIAQSCTLFFLVGYSS